MKLIIDNIFTILIVLLICICFFVQTYFEIEHLTTKEQVEENTKKINKLGAKEQIAALQSQITSLKADLTDTKADLTDTKADLTDTKADLTDTKTGLTNLNTEYTNDKKKVEKAMEAARPPAED